MMKRIMMTLLCMATVVLCMAQKVTADEARQKAIEFMTQRGRQPIGMSRKMMRHETEQATSPYYVFNTDGQQGYVIISGDERTETVLGYADEGAFDEDNIPDNMKAWLNVYAEQIKDLQEGRLKASPLRVPTHPAIRQMLNSRWDQGVNDKDGNAYNKLCPQISNIYCKTGCVATAMAQIMRYHQWPQSFSATIPKYTSNTTIGELAALPSVKFDWANMLDVYRGSENATQQNAVARLMRYCGQAVEMNYGTGSSSAFVAKEANALRTFFGYDTNTRNVARSDYTAATWDELIYSELQAGRPVLYNGSSDGGGHAFVCDGYDGKGYYHINWGWGGFQDGFFRLSIMNPDGGGSGASGTQDGYSMEQTAAVGIQPPTGKAEDNRALMLYEWGVEGNTISVSLINRTGLTGSFDYGYALQDMNDNSGEMILIYKTITLEPNYYSIYNIDVSKLNLPDGTYRFYPFSRLADGGAAHIPGQYTFYFEVVVASGNVKSITQHPKPKLTMTSQQCVSNKVVDMVQEIQVGMQNSGEEFNGIVYLFASQNRTNKGKAVNKTGMVVEAGATETVSLFFTPNAVGTWYVWADTDPEGKSGYSPLTVQIRALPTATSNLKVVSCNIDAKPETTVRFKVKNMGTDGYFMPLYCYLFVPEENWSIDGSFTGNLNLSPGAEAELTFNFSGLETGRTYYIGIFYHTNHTSNATANLMWSNDFIVENNVYKGDVEGDGIINITDAMCIIDYVLGKQPTKFFFQNADLDSNGKVDVTDAMRIVDIILGNN
ncbi:MAG: C10 family peptidase [Prevotella sp.]|nr:C10 family peptidase [Prevotella sp.]